MWNILQENGGNYNKFTELFENLLVNKHCKQLNLETGFTGG